MLSVKEIYKPPNYTVAQSAVCVCVCVCNFKDCVFSVQILI